MSRWKPVLGFENCYQVSDDGQVARTSTYGSNPKPKWKEVAKRPKWDGYITYHLCQGGKRTDPFAHRLVWEAFNGPLPPNLEINHKNGDRSDNRLDNLEAITRSENMKHKFRVLRCPPPNNPSIGSDNGSAKLTEADIPKIFAMYRSGKYQYEIAEIFGVTQTLISMIIRRKIWQHVRHES